MSVTLNLKPEVEAGMLAQAQAAGMTVEEYLGSLVENALPLIKPATLSAEERAAEYEAWSAGHAYTPPLSDYAISRASMYEGESE